MRHQCECAAVILSYSQRTGASESEALLHLMCAQSHQLSDSRGVRDVAVVINLSRWKTGRVWRFNECLHPLLVIAAYAHVCTFVSNKGSLCVNIYICLCVHVQFGHTALTHYIQLSHTVFDAAAVSGHTRVPAGVIRGDIDDQQGAIGHLLEPGRKTGGDRWRRRSGAPGFRRSQKEGLDDFDISETHILPRVGLK